MITLREFLGRAETKAVALVTLLGGVLKLPLFVALFSAIWGTAGELFAALSLAAFALAPQVSFIPTAPLTVLAVSVGGIVLIKRGRDWARSFYNRFRSET